ncbi:MAG TPA: radical SAM protein [Acidobacteriota bacterium]|nr:radical SAM protein [Acidobacteriota bacterium]HNT17305.1 radical SAM protein [Acidobacteriota bacterium]
MNTPLEEIARKIGSRRRLFYASLELTYACNFACRFCYNPIGRPGQGRDHDKSSEPGAGLMSLDEIVKLMNRLREGGVMYFTLTGGEPMVHQDFWEVAERAKQLAFALRVFTNGSLIDREAADRFERLMPNCVEISIYGASGKSYDESCGRPEAFEKVREAVRMLKDRGVTVFLKCMLTRVTEKEIEAIQDMADGWGCPLNWDPVLRRSDDGQAYPLSFSPGKASIHILLSDPGRFRMGRSAFEGGDGDGACNIGRNLLHVDPFGNIYPCIEWKEPLGNVRSADILEVWETHPLLPDLMSISREMEETIGALPVKCHFCMGQSMSRYGDPRRIDEDELEIARIREELARGNEKPARQGLSDRRGDETILS